LKKGENRRRQHAQFNFRKVSILKLREKKKRKRGLSVPKSNSKTKEAAAVPANLSEDVVAVNGKKREKKGKTLLSCQGGAEGANVGVIAKRNNEEQLQLAEAALETEPLQST